MSKTRMCDRCDDIFSVRDIIEDTDRNYLISFKKDQSYFDLCNSCYDSFSKFLRRDKDDRR